MQHWLLSHIKNSFISTDDTGICEAVMLSDDLPAAYLKNLTLLTYDDFESSPEKKLPAATTNEVAEFNCYPGLDDPEEDDIDLAQASYEIQVLGESGFQRQRLNTTTQKRLERMELARRKAGKIKTIKFEDNSLFDAEFDAALEKKVPCKTPNTTSLLTRQIEKRPKLPQNKYLVYAKFDGTAHTTQQTRFFKIFLSMLDEKHRNYPLSLTVLGSASVEELIGFICYKGSIQYPDIVFDSIKKYGLYMVEEDGEIDKDFPALEPNEPCGKFCFTYLALIIKKTEKKDSPSVRVDFPSFSMTSEAASKAEQALIDMRKIQQLHSEEESKLDAHNTLIEAPQYKIYRVAILNKARIKTEIQLAISGEKLEIDPVQQKNTKFWGKQKAVSQPMDFIAGCEKLEERQKKTIFRVYYAPNALSLETASPPEAASHFKQYDFETDHQTAAEIISKVNNILEISANSSRREYLALRDRQKKLSLNGKKKGGTKLMQF